MADIKYNYKKENISSSLSIEIKKPTNISRNSGQLAQWGWPANENQPNEDKLSNLMSCMEIDWGNAKWDGDNIDITDLINGSGIQNIKSSYDILRLLLWCYRKLNPEEVYSITWSSNKTTSFNDSNATKTFVPGISFDSLVKPEVERKYELRFKDNGETKFQRYYTYEFDGWSLSENGEAFSGNLDFENNCTFYSKWNSGDWDEEFPIVEDQEYGITWELNGSSSTLSNDITKRYIVETKWNNGENQTSYPIYINSYTEYYANNIFKPKNTSSWVIPNSITPPLPSQEFVGWYTSNNEEINPNNITSKLNKSGDTTFYARYREIEQTNYYWYAGQTQPQSLSSNPTVDDTNFTNNNWHTLNGNQISQTITGGTAGNPWYVAVPTTKEFSAYASDLVTPETSWDKITTITVKNISYDIWKPYSTGAKLNVYMK